MRRHLYPILCSGVAIALLLSPSFFPERRTRAEGTAGQPLKKKISRDIVNKVSQGHGADLVRIIIQPVNQPELSLDSTLEYTGSNIRKLKLFQARIVTLPAQAAVTLASRNDVAYVSLSREARPMGHLSATTGADQVRATTNSTSTSLDGSGIGIAIVDSGIDP